MSRLIFSTLALALLTTTTVFTSAANAAPVKVAAEFDKMYVPAGFDSNDNVQFVAEGRFKNTCYRPATPTIAIDEKAMQITLGPAAYEYSGLCAQVILPFERTIDVGVLKAGHWTVVQGTSKAKLGEFNIAQSRSEDADDFLYAPVTQVYFQHQGAASDFFVTGTFPNSCMSMDEVKVSIEKEVVVLQPIAKMETRDDCHDGKFPFSKKVTVNNIPDGRYLLHVRSMNGNAVNTLIDSDATTSSTSDSPKLN